MAVLAAISFGWCARRGMSTALGVQAAGAAGLSRLGQRGRGEIFDKGTERCYNSGLAAQASLTHFQARYSFPSRLGAGSPADSRATGRATRVEPVWNPRFCRGGGVSDA